MRDEREIFFEALDRAGPADRASYLKDACADDPEMHRRVSDLIRSHEQAGSFLGTPAPEQLMGSPGEELLTIPGLLAAPGRPDSLGRLGVYEVLEVVGRGGMGIVFRAFDESLHRMVAIKALVPSWSGRTARERFLRESRAAAAVQHEGVVSIFSVDDRGPVPFLVMPFIEGPTLQERVKAEGPLAPDEVVRIALEAAEGLAAAHARGLVHRDIKPANLLLERATGRVKITDFGLARGVDDTTITQSGLLTGTPSYMSPEQADGRRVDHRSDLFSLGSVLYFACTGSTPFGSGSMPTVLRKVCDQRPVPVRERNPAVPAWLAALIEHLHEKDPDSRPQTASEVAEVLRAGRTGPSRRRSRAPRGRGASAALAGVMLLGALATTEATGVTNLKGRVMDLLPAGGTLVVDVEDPAVSVRIEGTDLVLAGPGVREVRLRPGTYRVTAHRDGAPVSQELVQVDGRGRQQVRIRREATAPADRPDEQTGWDRAVASMPAEEQVKAVVARLKFLNPQFDGVVSHTISEGRVVDLKFCTDDVTDIRPLRVLRGLKSLSITGSLPREGDVVDLGPLRGLALERLSVNDNRLADLAPIAGMPLVHLECGWSSVRDLGPLRGMPIRHLQIQQSKISDLDPLRGMPLEWLDLYRCTRLSDLRPLALTPLRYLNIGYTAVTDLSPLRGLKELDWLILVNTGVTDIGPLAGLPKLDHLRLEGCSVPDLTPLRALRLTRLGLPVRPKDADLLRSLSGLAELNDLPVAEFWARYRQP